MKSTPQPLAPSPFDHGDEPRSLPATAVDASPLVSVITPTRCDPDRLDYLWALTNRVIAAGAEHVIVIDGDHPLPDEMASLSNVQVIRPGRSIGRAAVRNLGLLHARGRFITSADDDDELSPDGITVRANALDVDDSLAWVSGRLADIDGDGNVLGIWEPPAPLGFALPGAIAQAWISADAEFPLAPTGIMARRPALLSVGGWGGLPQGEDFAMALALTDAFPGLVLEDVVYHYRQHDGQMMRRLDFAHLESDVRRFCFESSRARR